MNLLFDGLNVPKDHFKVIIKKKMEIGQCNEKRTLYDGNLTVKLVGTALFVT